jgi:hypothetical protein
LPADLLAELKDLAKLAGVPTSSVIKIALAAEIQRHKRVAREAQS